ncbi:hypothetical protein B7494_g2220 [Chlorociboria aeruginascens]|nr:hypothetical protein B7494_g2220 [Chlorociboria aeruginascens]
MPSSVFEIKEHILECQHIREYARATSQYQEDILYLAIKQYIPFDNPHPKDGDITIIGAHANGFPKELYEPLWEDLYSCSKRDGFAIRSIWIADVAHQGASGVLNERSLGNDPSWMDHPRDLLHMINHFRAEMPLPLVGIGHSLGANILVNLALIHPRLLSTLVLLDPVIQAHATSPVGPSPAQASTFRRDLWPSRAEAEAAFRKQSFYKSWDSRVLDRWLEYGIREISTSIYPDDKAVTLTTTKHQECFTFLRPSYEAMSEDGQTVINRVLVPDMDPKSLDKFPFYRPEPPNTLARLGTLRPSVLFIFGANSPMSTPSSRKLKMETTGVAPGGSGGAKEGRVKEIVLKDIGHLVAMEASIECARAASSWLGQEVQILDNEKSRYVEWTKKSQEEKSTLSDEWKARIGRPPGKPTESKI